MITHPSPSNSETKSIEFTITFINFINQAIKGSILPFYDNASDYSEFISSTQPEVLDSFHDMNSIPLLLINYINYCWHSYHQKNDVYVLEKIDLIQSQGGFKHIYCTFDFIWEFSQRTLIYILGRIELPMIQDRATLSNSIDIMLDAIMAIQCDDLINFEGDNCICNKEQCAINVYKKDIDFIKVKTITI